MNIQTSFTATEAKNKLGLVFDYAQQQPVTIEKQGRPFVVVLSQIAYQRLRDSFFVLQAKEAEEEGFLSAEKSRNILENLLG